MSVWAKWYRHRPEGGYAAAPLDGNLALLETKNHRNRETLTASGKETRQQRSCCILVSDEAEMVDKMLGRVRDVNHDAFKALTLCRLYGVQAASEQLRIGKTATRHLKDVGFNMLMVELSQT